VERSGSSQQARTCDLLQWNAGAEAEQKARTAGRHPCRRAAATSTPVCVYGRTARRVITHPCCCRAAGPGSVHRARTTAMGRPRARQAVFSLGHAWPDRPGPGVSAALQLRLRVMLSNPTASVVSTGPEGQRLWRAQISRRFSRDPACDLGAFAGS